MRKNFKLERKKRTAAGGEKEINKTHIATSNGVRPRSSIIGAIFPHALK